MPGFPTIAAESIRHFPRVEGPEDAHYAILARDRSDEYTLFLYDSIDARDAALMEYREGTFYRTATPYNID